jgi:hypothetical protein
MRIVVHPYLCQQPKIQLREAAPVGNEFRAEMNQWLRDTFGMTDVAYITGDVCYVSPTVYVALFDQLGFGSIWPT